MDDHEFRETLEKACILFPLLETLTCGNEFFFFFFKFYFIFKLNITVLVEMNSLVRSI